jgi:hypothetical protein
MPARCCIRSLGGSRPLETIKAAGRCNGKQESDQMRKEAARKKPRAGAVTIGFCSCLGRTLVQEQHRPPRTVCRDARTCTEQPPCCSLGFSIPRCSSEEYSKAASWLNWWDHPPSHLVHMYHLVNCATATGRQVNETAAEAKDVLKSAGQVMHQGAAVVSPGVWTMFHADEDL